MGASGFVAACDSSRLPGLIRVRGTARRCIGTIIARAPLPGSHLRRFAIASLLHLHPDARDILRKSPCCPVTSTSACTSSSAWSSLVARASGPRQTHAARQPGLTPRRGWRWRASCPRPDRDTVRRDADRVRASLSQLRAWQSARTPR